jgi:hypothetical protein
MEVHAAPAVGKRLWSYVRAAFFMARNGKRKLLLSMHLLGANKRRGTKAVTRAVANLLTHHHHGHHANAYALRRRDYEFSCTNSPAAASSSSRRRLAYFPCLGTVAENEEEYGYQYDGYGSLSLPDAEPSPPLARIDYYAASPGDLDLAPGEEEYAYACAPSASASPALLLPGASGDFSVRVSNYSSEDEGVGNQAVDADAEEFIRRFYDQLRRQNTVAMLPYYMQETIAAA